MDLYAWLVPGVGIGVCSQEGSRVIVFCLPVPSGRPIVAVRGLCGDGGEVKSSRLGPTLRLLENVVLGRGVVRVVDVSEESACEVRGKLEGTVARDRVTIAVDIMGGERWILGGGA